ncbi:FMN-dependent NADH-azoreductase [Metamycoplasma arthritidis]|uniref:FMN-dependent NADH:quinone oxidoreductase n=1 Tax=Metamycoplasma arthritidis (strain 158L3-1) TaxID=243272 RepID=AZOR_META1|nr:FMN-dependent NADH-azoreductase [Metamycoplasma arthritidis]B3PM20.1 RecName: Full=FMN-dependent NADH:quinone oxidoreductase; AltName: Full=Azo-dye reductase; AltName: Full=FMN-dependent NADH-azo compound oxidoreductase; AltName: Full=FMN-dependent NADH-azoreductase [Metamycoplasma arthritidis 158L3-1]ACF07072.1 acyl carrier protein phosphodiesterase [Metamycoplasma arthritidis 158L3-1]VEU78600.1 FMN-dependent NADH-azoreductase [Metamycoplasma arthritidis]
MKKVLVLLSSPVAKENSYSTYFATKFVEEYQKINQEDEIKIIDLNSFDVSQKTLTSGNFATFFNENDSDALINELKSVDKLIVASPMINFNVPATLKNYLDHICVANKTFSYKYKAKGASIGLLDHLKVQIITSQGAPSGWYSFSSHTKYLEGLFNFLGIEIAPSIEITGTKVDPKPKEELYLEFEQEIIKKASEF